MQNICLVHHSLYSTRLLLLNWPKSCQDPRQTKLLEIRPASKSFHCSGPAFIIVSIPTKLNFLFSQCFQTILATLCKANQCVAPRVKLASFHLTTINNKVNTAVHQYGYKIQQISLSCAASVLPSKCSWCLESPWCLLQV